MKDLNLPVVLTLFRAFYFLESLYPQQESTVQIFDMQDDLCTLQLHLPLSHGDDATPERSLSYLEL